MPLPSIPTLADGNDTLTLSFPRFLENQTESAQVSVTPVSGPLKRKRPPSLEIPNVLQEIRVDTKVALRDCCPQDDVVCFNGSGVGVLSAKGRKKFMEDAHKIISSGSRGIKGFFGVYDGHGGRKAVEFVADNLHTNIFQMLENCEDNLGREEAVNAGYLKTDEDFLKQGLGSGACCVTALIEGNEIVVSNLGDCRAVLCRGGVAEALTKDHRAGHEDERKRIENKGGYVEIHRGAWRVHGVLSVSRSIGDAHLKDWVVGEPDSKTLCLTPDMEYLVLASDGLWEEVGNQEAVDTVRRSCLAEKKPATIHRDRDKNTNGFGLSSTSPSILQRVPPVMRKKKTGFSTSRKKLGSRKASENRFACENEIPPLKTRRISFELDVKVQSPNQEHRSCGKRQASDGLLAACNELVELAVTRGSLDDITVMIIDLNHFK